MSDECVLCTLVEMLGIRANRYAVCHRIATQFSNPGEFDSIRHFRIRDESPYFCRDFRPLVEMMGFEPMTPCLQGRCSPS